MERERGNYEQAVALDLPASPARRHLSAEQVVEGLGSSQAQEQVLAADLASALVAAVGAWR